MRRSKTATGGFGVLAGILLLLPSGASAGGWNPITLSKTVITPSGTCPGVDPLFIAAGTQVTYCYKVTNNSAITYTTHSLTDSVLGSIPSAATCGDLGPSAMCTVTETTTISVDTTNVATWVASTGAMTTTAADQAEVLIVTPPMITGGTAPGSSSVTGKSDATCVGGEVLIFDCGFPRNCHHCTGLTIPPSNTPCPDMLIGMGLKDANGNFNIPKSLLPGPGHAIYATDGCTDPGVAGPDVIIEAPSTAPLLSGNAVAMLVALLGVVGFVGVKRLRLNA